MLWFGSHRIIVCVNKLKPGIHNAKHRSCQNGIQMENTRWWKTALIWKSSLPYLHTLNEVYDVSKIYFKTSFWKVCVHKSKLFTGRFSDKKTVHVWNFGCLRVFPLTNFTPAAQFLTNLTGRLDHLRSLLHSVIPKSQKQLKKKRYTLYYASFKLRQARHAVEVGYVYIYLRFVSPCIIVQFK